MRSRHSELSERLPAGRQGYLLVPTKVQTTQSLCELHFVRISITHRSPSSYRDKRSARISICRQET